MGDVTLFSLPPPVLTGYAAWEARNRIKASRDPIAKEGRAFTQAEMKDAALEWMKREHADVKESAPDEWYAWLGLLVNFAQDLIPEGKDGEG